MKTISIGRNIDNSIIVDGSYSTVSGHHATIHIDSGNYVFEDHSSNGSYINGIRIHHARKTIFPDDVILLSSQYRLDNSMIFGNTQKHTVPEPFPKGRSTAMLINNVPEFNNDCHEDNNSYSNMNDGKSTDNASRDKVYYPANLHSFNFGAFMFGWLWGICNGVYVALLTLIPAINLIMCIVLGIKGNEWAWEKQKNTTSPANFLDAQRRWNKAAVICLVLSIFICLFYFVLIFSF